MGELKRYEPLTKFDDIDLYVIEVENGKKYVRPVGYAWSDAVGDEDKPMVYALVTMVCAAIPIEEFVENIKPEKSADYVNMLYQEAKQYEYRYDTEEELLHDINTFFNGECAEYQLEYKDITIDSPEGFYAATTSNLD
jgi:hypothetical protein